MLKLANPQIISFEYSRGNLSIQKIISYVNKNKIGSVIINNFPDSNILKSLKARFVSIDIDYFQVGEILEKISLLYNVGQIRILVDSVFDDQNLNTILKKINKNFKGSKILFFSFPSQSFDESLFLKVKKISESNGFVLSLLPLYLNPKNSKKITALLRKYKSLVLKERILLDSPTLLNMISRKKYYCPALDLSCHIDMDGNFMDCKWGGNIYGNIKKHGIQELWKKKVVANSTKRPVCPADGHNSAPYTFFSKVYDKIFNKRGFYQMYVDFILENFHKKDIKILDTACGTGSLIKELAKYYKNIQGMDLSAEMAKIARKKTGKKIFVGDLVNFRLKGKYDLVICAFDSINYVTDKNDFKKVINNFSRHLNKSGKIIFDFNPVGKFEDHFEKISDSFIGNNKVSLISSSLKWFWKIQLDFTSKEGKYIEKHLERFYSKKFVLDCLRYGGFSKIKFYDGSFSNIGGAKRYFIFAELI